MDMTGRERKRDQQRAGAERNCGHEAATARHWCFPKVRAGRRSQRRRAPEKLLPIRLLNEGPRSTGAALPSAAAFG